MIMNLENAWKEMQSGSSGIGPEPVKWKGRSGHPLLMIRRGLMITLIWGIGISIVYLLIMAIYPHWVILCGLGVVLAFNTWIGVRAVLMRRSIPDHIDPEKPLLPLMEEQHASVTNWMKMQLQIGKFIYPVSASTGFMLALLIKNGDLSALHNKPVVPIAMVVTALVMIPLGHWLAKFLFKYSYAGYLKHLQELINELKRD